MIIDDIKQPRVDQLILVPLPDGTDMTLARIITIYDGDYCPLWEQPEKVIYAGPDDLSFGGYYALADILAGDCPHCGGNLVAGKHSTTADGYCDDGSGDELPF